MKILTGLLAIFLAFGDTTSSASEESNCDLENAVEAKIFCPDENWLIRAMGSRSHFFVDAVAGTCTNMNEQMLSDEEEVHSFKCDHEEMSLSAKCPHEHHAITKFTLCVEEDHVSAITLYCRILKDPERIENYYNATSNKIDNLVDCGVNGVPQQIHLMESGNGFTAKVVFSCLKIKSKE